MKNCIDLQLLETIGDWASIEGTRLCGIFDTTFEKLQFGDRGIVTKITTYCFPTCEYPHVECNMELLFKGRRYTVGDVQHDNPQGWTCVELNKCDLC